jgi:type IV secretion system protein VirD4
VVIFENCKPILGEKIRYHPDPAFTSRLCPAPAVPRMDMALHLARVQQRWRYASDELAAGEGLDVQTLAYNMAALPDVFSGTPEQTAAYLLDFFSQNEPGAADTGGSIDAVADENPVQPPAPGQPVESGGLEQSRPA